MQSAPDSARDSARIVRRFPAIEVSAGRLGDPRSSATVHRVSSDDLRDLPLASLAQAIALQPGVIAVGEDIHVRGGRAGETQWTLAGLTLNEPLRDRAPEVPLMAVESADLLAGGLDAEYAGALAGVIALQTRDPLPHPAGALRWLSDGRRSGAYDWLGARGSLPLHAAGLGVVGALEARLDDQQMPGRHSRGRTELLGQRFGWRNDNHLGAWAKLAPIAHPRSVSLELLASRTVQQPWDPMFAYDDSVRFRFLNTLCLSCPPFLDSTVTYYRGTDHQPMSESRRLVATLQATRLGTRVQWHVATSWQHTSELTSPGLTRDPDDLYGDGKVEFGLSNDPRLDPLSAIRGTPPYFRRASADRWQAGISGVLQHSSKSRFEAGAGMLYDTAESFELDSALPTVAGIDTVRRYHTRAPGAWGYVQHRGEREGLVWNTGLRVQMFSAGDASAARGNSLSTGLPQPDVRGPGAIWTLSPRIGIALPLTERDAFSASYARIHQSPARDLLSDDRAEGYNRRPLGSPTLEPGELVTYQMGLQHRFNARWAAQASLFHRDLYGQVGVANEQYFPRFYRPRYANSEYGHATGFELALLTNRVPDDARAPGPRSWRQWLLSGEFALRYTQTDALGSLSGTDGWSYGAPSGFRAIATAEHPLDWDRGPAFEFDAVWSKPHAYTLAIVTQASGGARWTPTIDTLTATGGPPGSFPNLKAVNSRQLPQLVHTDVSLRLEPPVLHGARVLIDVRNLFGAQTATAVSVPGYPHPAINTERDDNAGYRTLTGFDGAAYWDPRLNGGRGGWVALDDPRLRMPARSVRLGLEIGL